MQNKSCVRAADFILSICGDAFGSPHLGRFLPKLGGIARCRHFFSFGVARSLEQTDAAVAARSPQIFNIEIASSSQL
jgi:hypothetical protein